MISEITISESLHYMGFGSPKTFAPGRKSSIPTMTMVNGTITLSSSFVETGSDSTMVEASETTAREEAPRDHLPTAQTSPDLHP
jgi:hypothetical protein